MLLSQFSGFRSFQFSNSGRWFWSQKTTAPVTSDFIASVIVIGLDGFNEFIEARTVTGINLCQCNCGAGLATNEESKTRFAFYDTVWYTHFSAKSWEVQHQLQQIIICQYFKVFEKKIIMIIKKIKKIVFYN